MSIKIMYDYFVHLSRQVGLGIHIGIQSNCMHVYNIDNATLVFGIRLS